MKQKNIIAINGSTRVSSTNLSLIHAIQKLTRDYFSIHLFTTIAALPQFNPDLDQDEPPQEITAFRSQLKSAEGILICTPEYAMGVPGALKNAIDWTVSSGEFSHKPTALITASLSGVHGHASLLETLKVIEAQVNEETQLVISFAKTKIKEDKISDEATRIAVLHLMQSLARLMAQQAN